MSPYASYLVETFLTLVVVCALAIVVLYGARRLGIGRPAGPVELWGQLPLDGRRAIYLVRVGEQVFVIGVAEGGMTKLGEVPAASLPARARVPNAPFAHVLARVLGQSKTTADRAGKDGEA
jgi:flagellar biogenesis protein FliO